MLFCGIVLVWPWNNVITKLRPIMKMQKVAAPIGGERRADVSKACGAVTGSFGSLPQEIFHQARLAHARPARPLTLLLYTPIALTPPRFSLPQHLHNAPAAVVPPVNFSVLVLSPFTGAGVPGVVAMSESLQHSR